MKRRVRQERPNPSVEARPNGGYQAREAVRHIIGLAGLASHRRPRLTSNVKRLRRCESLPYIAIR